MTEWRLRPHQYVGDGITDLLGAESCTCGLPRNNRLHKIKPTDSDVRQAEARRMGEKDN